MGIGKPTYFFYFRDKLYKENLKYEEIKGIINRMSF